MADFVFNIALGRVVEFATRINANDPANSALEIFALDVTGIETDAVLLDKDDMAAVVSGATNEATNGSYASIVIGDGVVTIDLDDSADVHDVDMPDQTFSAVAAGNAWGDIVIGYDSDSTGGTDANIIPCTQHDFAVTPDGSDITIQFNVEGFFRAT